MFATIESFDTRPTAFIQACYSKKGGNVDKMLNKLMEWARSFAVEDMAFMTKRCPEAWERRYKFKKTYTVMQRKIK